MSKIIEDLCNDAREEGREEGREETRVEMLKASILAVADLLSPEELARRFQVSLDFVKSVLGAAQQ